MTAKITQGLSCLDDALRRPVLHRARRVIDLADLRPPDEVGDGGRDVAHSGSRGLDLLVVVLALGGQCQEFVQAARILSVRVHVERCDASMRTERHGI